METHMQQPSHKQVPISGGGRPASTQREMKEGISETAESVLQQGKKGAEQLYEAACDACHNWRHYPKLLTTVLLLSAFLLGSGLTVATTKAIGWGGGRHYVSSHWDRETADAHHALDVVLDHLQHPHMYEGRAAEGYMTKARRSLYNLLEGIMPRRSKSGEYYEKAKDTGRSIYDKASEYADDLSYKARRGMDQAKEAGYGIGSKLSDMAHTVKETFVPSEYGERDKGWFSSGRGGRKSSSWFGSGEEEEGYGGRGRRGRSEEDEFNLAASKLRGVVHDAEREY